MRNELKASQQFQISGFYPDKSIAYRISIQLRLNGFSFILLNDSSLQVLRFQEFRFTTVRNGKEEDGWLEVTRYLEEIWSEMGLEGLSFSKIIISLDHNDYHLTPLAYFSTTNSIPTFTFSKNIRYSFSLQHSKVLATDRMLSFSMPLVLLNWVDENFSDYLLIHSCAIFQNEIFKYHKNKKLGTCVYAHVSHGFIHVLAMSNEDFLYLNSFHFHSKEEFIYFILLTYNQLHFNPEECPLYLLGDINPSMAYYKIAFQYIRNVDFFDKSNGIKTSYEFDGLSVHQNFIILQSSICE